MHLRHRQSFYSKLALQVGVVLGTFCFLDGLKIAIVEHKNQLDPK
jgi:hypothetical protein